MRKVQINLAAPGLRRTFYLTPRAARALAVVAAVLLPVAGIGVTRYTAAQHSYELQLAALHSRARAPAASPASLRVPQIGRAQAAAINAAVLQLNLPWRGLRDAVAAATPPTIALLSLEPDAKHGVLRITAEAKSSDDMIGYLEQIQAQEWFVVATLTRHEINEQDSNRPLRFQIDAQWRQP